MFLAVDVGNTNISFGVFTNKRLIRRFDLPQKSYSLKQLKKRLGNFRFNDCIICSVVPNTNNRLLKDFNKLTIKKIYVLGKDINVPIKNRYRYPKQVGQDRLVNAYIATVKYGAPLIAIDFGTAVTFDVVSKKKEYLGGMILPGLKISLEALNHNTALLPKIKLRTPLEFIGRDTKSSMISGLVNGFAALTEELIKRIRIKIGRKAKVIATGGNIKLIAKLCKSIDSIENELTLKGIFLIYENLKKSLDK